MTDNKSVAKITMAIILNWNLIRFLDTCATAVTFRFAFDSTKLAISLTSEFEHTLGRQTPTVSERFRLRASLPLKLRKFRELNKTSVTHSSSQSKLKSKASLVESTPEKEIMKCFPFIVPMSFNGVTCVKPRHRSKSPKLKTFPFKMPCWTLPHVSNTCN